MKSTMRVVLCALVLLITFSACKKIVNAVFPGTNIDLPKTQFTIRPIPIADSTNEISGGVFVIYINADSIIKANTAGVFGINAISSVTVKEVTLQCLNGDAENNLSAIRGFRLAVSSNTDSASLNVVSIKIPATTTNTYTETLNNSPNIREYLKNTSINEELYFTMRKTTAKDLTLTLAIKLLVK